MNPNVDSVKSVKSNQRVRPSLLLRGVMCNATSSAGGPDVDCGKLMAGNFWL